MDNDEIFTRAAFLIQVNNKAARVPVMMIKLDLPRELPGIIRQRWKSLLDSLNGHLFDVDIHLFSSVTAAEKNCEC